MLSSSLVRQIDPKLSGPSDAALALDNEFADLLARSYSRRFKAELIPHGITAPQAAAWLYDHAPFCLLAHNTAADPRFIYANQTAQKCFEYTWQELTSLPSRLSALPADRDRRQQFIDQVTQHGFAVGYRGPRVAKSGRLFWIENVTMWQVTDADGMVRAQAAVYRRWHDADANAAQIPR